jgi:hypothetical protein
MIDAVIVVFQTKSVKSLLLSHNANDRDCCRRKREERRRKEQGKTLKRAPRRKQGRAQ